MAVHVVPPLPLSLIVCERVIVDAVTKQYNLIGLIAHVQATAFPVAVPSLAIYSELTNGHGLTTLRVRVVDTNEQRDPVFEADLHVNLDEPLAVSQMFLGLTNPIFPEPGEYRVQVLCGMDILIERRLLLVPIAPPAPQTP